MGLFDRLARLITGRPSDSTPGTPIDRVASEPAAVTREDERFGTLTYDPALCWYQADALWNGEVVQLQLEAEQEHELPAALRTANALWDDQPGWSERIQAYALAELLPLKNEDWLDDHEEPLTPEQFLSRMRVESISVGPDGGFIFFHDDGDLFAGHTIQVTGSLLEGPTDADIPG